MKEDQLTRCLIYRKKACETSLSIVNNLAINRYGYTENNKNVYFRNMNIVKIKKG